MAFMFVAYRGSQDQESQSCPQDAPSQSWYPPFVANSSSYSRPSTPNSYNVQRPFERPQSPSHVSPAEAARIISSLKDKSADELRKLLTDKEAYNQFLLDLDQVKAQNNVRDELKKEMLHLARSNLDKEPQIVELRNQCRIIRTTELASALEKLNDLEKKKEDLLKCYSSASLLHRLQEETNKTDEDSDNLHSQFLEREIELAAFFQKHKKLRSLYHRRTMTHLAAKTS
ncbi:vacuolar protein-sorting-associated protein 37 homolog 1-like isoform X1 [Chenopodium quinoa]|uniref:vacuolar protein-sorting-associated protein 37 homolog 1-like isoform X1 n=1 Tax=Chenopodium quinoa TaxID=63459 RepID=UPI000B76D6A9|nr:vacuolar protein-sorting-associated protein 37 homolog 1-like isoform X1 [Chenopodium quinoa]